MQYLTCLGRTTVIVVGFIGAMFTTTVAYALGTDVNTTVTNNVSLTFTVNSIGQSASATVDFLVDRKLVVDVTAGDADWVTVVPGQLTDTGDLGIPAMNFSVTNRSNDAADVIVGVLDQDGTQVTGFNPVGVTVFNEAALVVAIDSNGNNAFDDGVDAELTLAGGFYDLGNMLEDAVINLVVAVDVPGASGNDEYAAYTLVAAVANAGAPVASDDSGNIAPASGAPPANIPNGIVTLETVFADLDALTANAEDEQFDFFAPGIGPIGGSPTDSDFDGQNADSSGLVTGTSLALAKYVEVVYDPLSGNRYDAAGLVIADPKSIPGAVMMYVIGLVNESAALDATLVTIADDIPDGVPELVDEGDQRAGAPPAIDLPISVTFNVGTGPQVFNVGNASNIDEVYSEGCADAGTSAAYNGAGVVLGGDDVANPEFSRSVGTCAASEAAFVVYFVTIN